jgi:hypothetical protein
MCGSRDLGWSAQDQQQFGWKVTGCLVTTAGYGSQATGNNEYRRKSSPAQNLGKNEGRHDRCVGFDDEFRSVDAEFSPRDLLIRHRA